MTGIAASIEGRSFFDGQRVRAIPPREVTELMLDLLALKPTDKVLEIGTGSATQTAEWAMRAKEVHTVELRRYNCCESLGNHVYFREADGKDGLCSEAPFDAIVVTCGTTELYPEWIKQLAEGGRLVVPMGNAELQRITLFMKVHGVIGAVRVGGYSRFQMMEKR